MIQPQRIQLRRTKGWRLQAVSMALNGLPARKVTRPGPFGNHHRTINGNAGNAARLFACWLRDSEAGRALAARARAELADRNLACVCDGPHGDCHADYLLMAAAGRPIVIPPRRPAHD